MNTLIILPEEMVGSTSARITGARVQSVQEAHELAVALEIRACLWGKQCGRARVISVARDEILLETQFTEDPPPKAPIDLVVAVARPQTVKKVIQCAHAYGVRSLHFVRGEKSVRSYLDSKSLTVDAIWEENLKSMEQTGDCVPVDVHVHSSWREFSGPVLETLSANAQARLLADTRSERSVTPAKGSSYVLAVGPEAGWSERELERFSRLGFEGTSLGPRMLRVEHAVAMMIAKSLVSLPS